jgi:hypothetical protein
MTLKHNADYLLALFRSQVIIRTRQENVGEKQIVEDVWNINVLNELSPIDLFSETNSYYIS